MGDHLVESQQPYTRYVEQIDYKTIIVKQIDYIHQGVQLGSTTMIKNGVLSLELLLSPLLDDDAKRQIEALNEKFAQEIDEIEQINVAPRAYERERQGQIDPDAAISQKRFEQEQEKYKVLLAFAKKKDLLMAEIEEDDLSRYEA